MRGTAVESREERIRAKAYELWEADGKPGDRDENHWADAERLIDEEDRAKETSHAGVDIAPSPDGDIHPAGLVGVGQRSGGRG